MKMQHCRIAVGAVMMLVLGCLVSGCSGPPPHEINDPNSKTNAVKQMPGAAGGGGGSTAGSSGDGSNPNPAGASVGKKE